MHIFFIGKPSLIVAMMLVAIICLIIGVALTYVRRKKNKEAVALLEKELDDITNELSRIKGGSKSASLEHKESLVRREHEIVRILVVKYPKTTQHKYDNYRYRYDD